MGLIASDKPASRALADLTARARHTFGPHLTYVGTTTELNGSPRDVDVLLVLDRVDESHVAHVWQIIRNVRARYSVALDVRIEESAGLARLGVPNRYLLQRFLRDLIGSNPFADSVFPPDILREACRDRILEQADQIVKIMPRVADETAQLRAASQSVFDAIRAFLIIEGEPCAQKEAALLTLCRLAPAFAEARTIHAAYVDPYSVLDVSAFIVDCLALVKHLGYRTRQYEQDDEVLLINTPPAVLPHPRDDYLRYDHNMPLGLACLAAFLRAAGKPVRILDAYAENLGALAIIDRIFRASRVPRAVGFNACSPNIHVVHALARHLKRICPQIVTICGGPHASLAPEHTLSTGDIDYVVQGEGEQPLLDLLNALRQTPAEVAKVPGIVTRQPDGALATTAAQAPLDLANLPPPALDLLPLSRYFAVKKRVYLHTTRGCAFRCVYCSVPETWGKAVRELPMGRFLEQLRDLVSTHEATELQVVDDNFSHRNGALIRQFCELLSKETLQLRWKCQVRADQIPDDLPAMMAAAGCFEVDFGVESGSADVQRYIKKRLDLDKARKLISAFANLGVATKAFFMLGFPVDSWQTMADTINYAITLAVDGLSDVAFFPVMPFPGTEIARVAECVVHQGAVIDDTGHRSTGFAGARLKKYSARPEVSLTSLLTAEELRLLVKFAYQRFHARAPATSLEQDFRAFQRLEEEELYAWM